MPLYRTYPLRVNTGLTSTDIGNTVTTNSNLDGAGQSPAAPYVPAGLKPFNLKEALAGKPVVTRKGKKVTHISDIGSNIQHPVSYVTEKHSASSPYHVNRSGGFLSCDTEYDLFMAKEKVTRYVNLFKSFSGNVITGSRVYKSEVEARGAAVLKNYITTVPVTYEV